MKLLLILVAITSALKLEAYPGLPDDEDQHKQAVINIHKATTATAKERLVYPEDR